MALLRHVRLRDRVVLGLLVVVLTLAPAFIAAARPSSIRADLQVAAVSRQLASPENLRAYVARRVDDRAIREYVSAATGRDWGRFKDHFDDVEVTLAGQDAKQGVVMSVPGDSAPDARQAARLIGERLTQDGRFQLQANRQLARLERLLRSSDLSAMRRREIRSQARFILAAYRALGRDPVPVTTGVLSTERLRGVEKAIDSLPGARPPRTSPVWAGIAGLMLGLALCSLWLLLRSGARGHTIR